jgi:flagellar protein FlgJ
MIGAVTSPATAPAAEPGKADPRKRDELDAAAQAFEAVFLRQMIGSMRQASLGDELFGSSAADQFRDMQDAKLADSMAASNSLGIARMLIEQFEGKGGAR